MSLVQPNIDVAADALWLFNPKTQVNYPGQFHFVFVAGVMTRQINKTITPMVTAAASRRSIRAPSGTANRPGASHNHAYPRSTCILESPRV